MSYKFNNGFGAVACDNCRRVYDSELSFQEYLECYGEYDNFCPLCARGTPTVMGGKHGTEQSKGAGKVRG